jgi:hypothetical protein
MPFSELENDTLNQAELNEIEINGTIKDLYSRKDINLAIFISFLIQCIIFKFRKRHACNCE